MLFILSVIYSNGQVKTCFSSTCIAKSSDSSHYKYSFKQAVSQNPRQNIRLINDRQKNRGWSIWK